MKNSYILFPISLLLVVPALLLSFSYEEITSTVEGTVVDVNGNPVFNAEVYLPHEAGEIHYYEPTDKAGKFKLKFNAVEGKPQEICVRKDDRTLVREKIIPTSHRERIVLNITLDLNKGKAAVTQVAPASLTGSLDEPTSTTAYRND